MINNNRVDSFYDTSRETLSSFSGLTGRRDSPSLVNLYDAKIKFVVDSIFLLCLFVKIDGSLELARIRPPFQ